MTFEEYVISKVQNSNIENFELIIEAMTQQEVAAGIYLKKYYSKQKISSLLAKVFGKATGKNGPRNFVLKRQFDNEIKGLPEDKTVKKCNTCNEELLLSEFYSNGFTPNGTRKYKPSCKKCAALTSRERLNAIIKEHFGFIGCSICGYNNCLEAIEFHHVNPKEKEFRLSEMASRKKEIIQLEMSKGILVCANCHREIHYGLHPEYLLNAE